MRKEFYTNQLFEGIDKDVLDSLEIEPEPVSLEPGDILFSEGAPGDAFYIVAEGTIRISKGEGEDSELLNLVRAGEFFGEMAVVDGQPRSASATAEDHCVLGRIGSRTFDRLATASSQLTRNFVRTLVRRLRTTDDLLIHSLLLAERTSLIGKMTNSIVHDLRNPVQNILMAVDFLGTFDSDELRHVAALLEKSANRMARMLQELLDFSKGRPDIVWGTHTAKQLATVLDEEILTRLEGKGIEVHREIRYEGEFRADFERLLRVLINIIRNADEAMNGKGALTLATSKQGDNMLVQITDTGKGIPEASLAKIFEPFFSEGKADGTGIGMSMAKKLVESHGGEISVTSELGVGTTFHVLLPIDGGGVAEEGAEDSPSI
ncbi:MAG: ATP-binding protein [Verrucomicrobiales bacterium]